MTKPLAITTAALSLVSGVLCHAAPPSTQPLVAPATAPAPAPATAPATQPAQANVPLALPARPAIVVKANVVVNGAINANNMVDVQRRQLESQRAAIAAMKSTATYKQQELIRFILVDGQLRAETSLNSSVRGQIRLDVSDTGGMWTAICQDLRRRASVGLMVVINRYDFDKTAEGDFWRVSLNLNDQYLMIHEQGIDGGAWFQQINGTVHLNATSMKNGRGQQLLNLQAADILHLHAEHPEEVRKYLVPMLVRLSGRNVLRPGAADVYTVFAEIPPDPIVARQVAKLLPGLDAESFSDRDQASRELFKLGAPGVLAVLRLDPDRLSMEQKGRIDAFLATERRRSVDDAAAMRKDVNFLLDALEDDDQVVRIAARACLEKAVGHAVAFDVFVAPEKRGDAIDALRLSLKVEAAGKAAGPTTRPHPVADGIVQPLKPLLQLIPAELRR